MIHPPSQQKKEPSSPHHSTTMKQTKLGLIITQRSLINNYTLHVKEKQQNYSQSNTTYDAKVVIKTVGGPILAASATVISGSLMQCSHLFFSVYN